MPRSWPKSSFAPRPLRAFKPYKPCRVGLCTLLLGNYTILERLGSGGTGQVFKAEHRKMHRTVAIKLLSAAVTGDPALVARFEQDLAAASKLQHPTSLLPTIWTNRKGSCFWSRSSSRGVICLRW